MLSALCWTSWACRLARALGRAIASVVLLSLIASCGSTKQISRETETRANTNYTNVTNERDSVVIAERDTLKEVTTVTVQLNETGDTVRVSTITDRTRASSRDRVRDVEIKVVERTDTVYIEKRDSVFVQTDTNLTNPTNKKPGFLTYLKWIFALTCAIVVLIITIKVCLTCGFPPSRKA